MGKWGETGFVTETDLRELTLLRRGYARLARDYERALAFRQEEIRTLLARCDHRRPDGSAALAGITIRCALCGRFVSRETIRREHADR